MEFRIRLHPRVQAAIASWGLTTSMLVDVYLELNEILGADPSGSLRRDHDGDGSFFTFELREDDLFTHVFNFRVYFEESETHLHIVSASTAMLYAPQ